MPPTSLSGQSCLLGAVVPHACLPGTGPSPHSQCWPCRWQVWGSGQCWGMEVVGEQVLPPGSAALPGHRVAQLASSTQVRPLCSLVLCPGARDKVQRV